jgi:hypothetical protein
MPAKHHDPLEHVRRTAIALGELSPHRPATICLDISTFTKKHLLQLLHGLDLAGMLHACRLYYTEPEDFHTSSDQPLSEGVESVHVVDTFGGNTSPSKDTLLILFLGYEGRRAAAVWEHLEPNVTVAVIPDPPYRESWQGRTEVQNRHLLSCVPRECVLRSHSLDPGDTVRLLSALIDGDLYPASRYNYVVAPIGTKPQTVGLYRFWKQNPRFGTIVYAEPTRHKEEEDTFPAGRTWEWISIPWRSCLAI